MEEQPHYSGPPGDRPEEELPDTNDNAPLPKHRGWEWQADQRYDRSPAPSPELEQLPQQEEAEPQAPRPHRSTRDAMHLTGRTHPRT
jgi:hypothetical protein